MRQRVVRGTRLRLSGHRKHLAIRTRWTLRRVRGTHVPEAKAVAGSCPESNRGLSSTGQACDTQLWPAAMRAS